MRVYKPTQTSTQIKTHMVVYIYNPMHPGMMLHIYNPSTLKVEAGGLQFALVEAERSKLKDILRSVVKLKISLGNMASYFKTKTNNQIT